MQAVAMTSFYFDRDAGGVLEFAAREGFGAVEVLCDIPFCHVDAFMPEEREKLAENARENKIKLIAHAPMFGMNLCCLNPGIRRESLRQHIESARMISAMGGRLLVAHSGELPSQHQQVREVTFRLALDSLKRLVDEAERIGVTIALENVAFNNEGWERNAEDLLMLSRESGAKICFDTGHAHVAWGDIDAISGLADEIVHVHVSDNFGAKDDHLALGDGAIDFAPLIDFLAGADNVIVTHECLDIADPSGCVLKSRNRLGKALSVSGQGTDNIEPG